MRSAARPHLLGIDDGPFARRAGERDVAVVAVMMEGADLVEGVATTRFAIDGDDATGFLARWIGSLRFQRATQGIVLGGITIAGLGVVDVPALAAATARPVLILNRFDPTNHRLAGALAAAGLHERLALVERCPPARPLAEGGPWLACSGIQFAVAADWALRACRKARLPEPLRLAHLFARAMTTGQSRGRA
ncbi:MAG: DUF99 domain-containing protein [Proteobacteria bacterium]|nr:MAG: DUF99 domain-containing protein [Pseudomonadota bacterium]